MISRTSSQIYLENRCVRFEFELSTGSLSQIVFLEDGKKVVKEAHGARLFRMVIPHGGYPATCADSHEGPAPAFEQEGDNILYIKYPSVTVRGNSLDIAVTIKVTLRDDDTEALFDMSLVNGSQSTIEEIRFPWLGGITQLTDRGEDTITLGSKHMSPSKAIQPENPHYFMRWRERLAMDYPFPLLLPYMDYSGGGSGIGYICYPKELRYGTMGIERIDPYTDYPSYSLGWANCPYVKPGEAYNACQVGISVHNKDWHATARRFREWVGTWWKKPDTPKRLRESIGLMNVQFISFDGTPFMDFDDYERICEDAQRYGVDDILLWHRSGGTYTQTGSTREIMDESPELLAKIKKAMEIGKKKGVNSSYIINRRVMNHHFDPYRDGLNENQALKYMDGSLINENYTFGQYNLCDLFGPDYKKSYSVVMCQRENSLHSDRAEKVIDKLFGLGIDSIFIDQPINFNMCFDRDHGHDHPDDAPGAAVRWMKDVRGHVRGNGTESYVIGELPELFQTEQVDWWWHWPWRFMAPEVYRYSMPGPKHLYVIEGDPGEANLAFALGDYVCLVPHGMEKLLEAHPELGEQVKKLAALRKRTAAFTVDLEFTDNDGLFKNVSAGKNIVEYSYSGDGRASVIIAETQNTTGMCRTSFTPAFKASRSHIYFLDGTSREVYPNASGEYYIELDIAPYAVAVWTFEA